MRAQSTYTFLQIPQLQKIIKVSQENCVVVLNRYSTFEDFKAEAVARIKDFSAQFDIGNYQRVGLRYVNHIELPPEDLLGTLQRFVNVPVDLERFDPKRIEQFMTEFRLRTGVSKLTVRGALIQVPASPQQTLYILDLDCYSYGPCPATALPDLLEGFHREIQIQFLEHIREEYKIMMRGAR